MNGKVEGLNIEHIWPFGASLLVLCCEGRAMLSHLMAEKPMKAVDCIDLHQRTYGVEHRTRRNTRTMSCSVVHFT